MEELKKEVGVKPIPRRYLKREVRDLSVTNIIRFVRKKVEVA
ncbi:MAG: hypothetical protein Q6363_008625 [Candidatus Njordarchaeota archaeon]